MNLIVSERGTFLALRSERLRLQMPNQEPQEVALRDLQTVTVTTTACTLSAEAIRACATFGVQIDLVDGLGAPYAKFSSPYLVGTVSTRRAQMTAYLTPVGVEVACHAIRARLRNQASLLKYFGKYRKEADPAAYEVIQRAQPAFTTLETELDSITGANIDEVRDVLLGLEGRGGVVYWGAVAALLPADLAFPGRLGRGATDPTNMTLNYGYGILYARAAGVLATAGLEPFAGFLHTDRPGKPSLVLDFVEGFRAACVDRPVLALQDETLVVREHRGHRLGMRLKLANLEQLTAVAPEVTTVYSWTHSGNDRMNWVNAQLGFQEAGQSAIWEQDFSIH